MWSRRLSSSKIVDAANDWWSIVVIRTVTARVPGTHDGEHNYYEPTKEGTPMSGLSKLHQLAAEHHDHAARHHREAAKLQEAKDVVAAAEQARLANDHQGHAIRFAAEAVREYESARHAG